MLHGHQCAAHRMKPQKFSLSDSLYVSADGIWRGRGVVWEFFSVCVTAKLLTFQSKNPHNQKPPKVRTWTTCPVLFFETYCVLYRIAIIFKKQMLSYTSVSAKILLTVVFPRQILQFRAPEKSLLSEDSFEDFTAQGPWTGIFKQSMHGGLATSRKRVIVPARQAT